ncbi:hypothetical protein [Desulfopila sp. IMCC35008]|uniref:hypothetical protein n=1 Tax=Desulfopila sp. IMCC35008 TaxID=2653858 RepID=UPI0013D2EFD3|nr:hypothetical protein [Desulfopila sp. IMCC35008]
MNSSLQLPVSPFTILIVGTDASGKDHVANVVTGMIDSMGGTVEKRKRYLSGRRTSEESSTEKRVSELFLEKSFLTLYPLFSFLMPWCMNVLLKKDLARFNSPGQNCVVIGHNCLRGLAFYWGHRYTTTTQITMSPALKSTLARLNSLHGLHTIVLDVDDGLRRERIAKRELLGEADYFDRYMAENGKLSERIESFLVWLTVNYLGATLIENNNLSDRELRTAVMAGIAGSPTAI